MYNSFCWVTRTMWTVILTFQHKNSSGEGNNNGRNPWWKKRRDPVIETHWVGYFVSWISRNASFHEGSPGEKIRTVFSPKEVPELPWEHSYPSSSTHKPDPSVIFLPGFLKPLSVFPNTILKGWWLLGINEKIIWKLKLLLGAYYLYPIYFSKDLKY